MKWLHVFWLMLFLVACLTHPIQSTNLTDIDIPAQVTEMVWDRIPTDSDISITYPRKVHIPSELAEVEVCYEVIVGEEKLYGLASVKGNWYVTVLNDNLFQKNCPSEWTV